MMASRYRNDSSDDQRSLGKQLSELGVEVESGRARSWSPCQAARRATRMPVRRHAVAGFQRRYWVCFPARDAGRGDPDGFALVAVALPCLAAGLLLVQARKTKFRRVAKQVLET